LATLRFILLGVLCSNAAPCLAEPTASGHPIIGTWSLLVPGTACKETWQFFPDGTSHNVSGSEVSTSNYEIIDWPNLSGYYVLTDTIRETNGKPDCNGGTTLAGDRVVLYLIPVANGGFKICHIDTSVSCIGTMTRVAKPNS
jgi:hypothetical protein